MLGLIRTTTGQGYVVEYDGNDVIIAASAPVELGVRDWTEEDLEGWHMEPAEWLNGEVDYERLPIPYLPAD